LPLYFTGGDEFVGRNDFLGRAPNGQTLKSFGINPGGYVGFYGPTIPGMDTYNARGDKVAEKRMEIKKKAEGARRASRYQRFTGEKPDIRLAKQETRASKAQKKK
jgi:hypothetical protein